MKRGMGRILVVLLLLGFMVHGIIAASVPNNSHDLLAASVPIAYGEQLFRQRILEQTGGERDPVGLVLSGGSARAFAHIGVLELLEETDVVPDFIISNSMGSIVGILYAAGLSPAQIRTVISQLDITQLFDLSVPLGGGVLDISRFLSVVAAHLGKDLRIEELPVPIMIVCEDLATRRQVRIMEGSLMTVMGAAFALPVYFPPVAYNGHLLVDGGITNLVPLEIAYAYTDTAIVSTTFYDAKHINLRNPLSILNVSIDIGKRRTGVQELLDQPDAVWIRCDVEDFSFMAFSAVEELAEIGYESAAQHRERLEQLRNRGPTERMLEARSSYAKREGAIRNAYSLYQRTRHLGFSQQLFFGLRSFNYPGDRWFLRDDLLAGAMYQVRWHMLWLSLYGGGGWQSISPMALYPGLNARLSVQPAPPIVLEADLVVSGEQGLWLPTVYHRLGLQVRQRWFTGAMTATVSGWWEEQRKSDFSLGDMLVHTSLSLRWEPERSLTPSLELEGGWQLAGAWDRQFLHTRVDATMSLPLDLQLNLGYTGRYAIDGGGSVPIYFGDGFKTRDQAILEQGRIGSAVRTEQMVIIGRAGIDWQPASFKPTAGELLIFERSAVGIFSDLLWNGSSSFIPEVVAGARLRTTISFLGLNSMPVSMYVGYDSPTDGIVWGFTFGR